jgi:hypothetical protein
MIGSSTTNPNTELALVYEDGTTFITPPSNDVYSGFFTLAVNPTPQIHSAVWTLTCPAPYVYSSVPRQGEPVLIDVNATEESGGSYFKLTTMGLSYRAGSGVWWSAPMTLNATTRLWTITIPGQPGNSTVEFYCEALDNAGNLVTSTLYTYNVKALIPGDINGDGVVNGQDLHILAQNWGR